MSIKLRICVVRNFLKQQQIIIKNIKRYQSSIDRSKKLHPDIILNEKTRNEFIERLKNFKSIKTITNNEPKIAAVLVPLCIYKGELGLLYTLRSKKLSLNGGQVSFPGGMRDNNDKNIEETALRETWEELNIPMNNIDIWTKGNSICRKHVIVTPVFGFIGNIEPDKLNINQEEVDEAFVVSLDRLCNDKYMGFTLYGDNQYKLPTFEGHKHHIWGLTAIITHIIMTALVPDVYKHKIQFLSNNENSIKPS
ncbi:hypothetical protein HCN44_005115 [Aphidius gifuensis]|uniref:Nudix hydrolase domain-containing protein n=1 Tax=Aphidius gifuensis TaxID=684658 RepID=A0A834XU24_APHGI|nr:nucleoside diphosphate-linked moiety X motif 8 [Aphidius gifuensis]KAF7992771.1 hypothetical protein HCN44_005115 [Aphidius gifuensis]